MTPLASRWFKSASKELRSEEKEEEGEEKEEEEEKEEDKRGKEGGRVDASWVMIMDGVEGFCVRCDNFN